MFHRGSSFIRVTVDPTAGLDFRPSPEDIEALAWEANRVLGKCKGFKFTLVRKKD